MHMLTKEQYDENESMRKEMNYTGKIVTLYPGDSYTKEAKVLGVDEFGWYFEITFAQTGSDYKAGEKVFISHSKPLIMKIKEEV